MAQIALPPWPELILFMASVLVVSMFVITAAGHFPREARKPELDTPSGAAALWASMLMVAPVGVLALFFAWVVLPWYAAVIGAGLMILIAPYVLHPLPDAFVNGRAALLALGGFAIALGGGMWWSLAERI